MAPTVMATVAPPALAVNGCLQAHLDGRRVHNLQDLECLRTNAAAYLGETIYQTADIELNGWTTSINGWYGTFNGGGFRITDDDNPEPQAALFDYTSGPITINNVHRSGDVTTIDPDQSFAAFTGGFVAYASDTVTIKGSSMTGDVTATRGPAGGFVGNLDTGRADFAEVKIIGSSMIGDVMGNYLPTASAFPVGGLVGIAYGEVNISSSSRFGNTGGGSAAGGLVGATTNGNLNSSDVTITNSFNIGDVTAVGRDVTLYSGTANEVTIRTGATAAGLVANASNVRVTTSYSSGDVSLSYQSPRDPLLPPGGFNTAGGLVGWVGTLEVDQSYSSGEVTDRTTGIQYVRLGGFAGFVNEYAAITDSYSAADVLGESDASVRVSVLGSGLMYLTDLIAVGGFVGGNFDDVHSLTVIRSYVTGDVTIVDPLYVADVDETDPFYVGEFIGYRRFTTVSASNSFCLTGSSNCGIDDPNVAKSVSELKSTNFLTGQGWDFVDVWCVRAALNDGFPVLRAINFGPGNTNNCREPGPIVSVWRASLDPNGGACVDGAARGEPWNSAFIGYRYLPGPSDCTRSGYTFAGWASTTTPTKIRSFPLLIDPASNTRRYFVAENLDLIAVWTPTTNTPTTSAITDLVVFANFLCGPCTNAWLIYTSPPDTTNVNITIDDTPVTCNRSSIVFGLSVCELINLAPGAHTVTLTPTIGTTTGGRSTASTFTLRG